MVSGEPKGKKHEQTRISNPLPPRVAGSRRSRGRTLRGTRRIDPGGDDPADRADVRCLDSWRLSAEDGMTAAETETGDSLMSEEQKDSLWRCCSMHDPAGRRGIWYRYHNGILQIRAGREGDDEEIDLEVGRILTQLDLDKISGALDSGGQMQEDYGPCSQINSLNEGWGHGGLEENKASIEEERKWWAEMHPDDPAYQIQDETA